MYLHWAQQRACNPLKRSLPQPLPTNICSTMHSQLAYLSNISHVPQCQAMHYAYALWFYLWQDHTEGITKAIRQMNAGLQLLWYITMTKWTSLPFCSQSNHRAMFTHSVSFSSQHTSLRTRIRAIVHQDGIFWGASLNLGRPFCRSQHYHIFVSE